MPIFRELWSWAIFVILAIYWATAAIISTDKSGDLWQVSTDIGQKVSPLWIASAIAVYTIAQGCDMLAERYLRRRYNEGKAEGEAKANEYWRRMLDAYPDKTAAEIRRMVDSGELPRDS